MESPSTSSSFAFTSRPNLGRNAHLYQPPPNSATPPDYFCCTPRKRSRADSSHAHGFSKQSYTPRTTVWAQCPTLGDGSYTSALADSSASVSVNERYTLAGGFDTPGIKEAAEMERSRISSELSERRRTRGADIDSHAFGQTTPLSGPLARERNGIPRLPSFDTATPPATWTGLAFGLVGKVFNFGSSVIRGFYSGGGAGFDLRQGQSPDMRSTNMWDSQERVSTPVPGSWGDFDGDFEQDNPQSESRPRHKRRQTDRDSWVLVGSPDRADDSPRRKVSGNAAPRVSRPSASKASSRRSLAPTSRRQTAHVAHGGSPAQLPTLETPRRTSVAPMRSPHSRPSSSGFAANAYISPDAERFARRQAKQEKAADKAVNSMSKRIEDLIRQGQAALGTKFTVEEEGDDGAMDEGFVEDDGW